MNIGLFFIIQIPAANEWLFHLRFDSTRFLPYQWVTYMFLHSGTLHLLFNMVSLFFAGIAVEQSQRTKEFLYFYIFCGIGGALLGYFVSAVTGTPFLVEGASGAIFGLFYALYRFYPDATMLIFFVFPMKIKHALLLLGLISLALMFESSGGVAHFSHLGGLLTAIAWFRYSDSIVYLYDGWKRKQEVKNEEIDIDVKKNVDEILEKISKEGIGALTKKERQFLNKASNRFRS